MLERSDADRAALVGRLRVRDNAAWLAELLMDLEDDVGELARLRLGSPCLVSIAMGMSSGSSSLGGAYRSSSASRQPKQGGWGCSPRAVLVVSEGVFAAPSRAALCAVVDGLAYLVDVEAPGDGAVIAHDQVSQVVPVPARDLLLLVRMIDIVALGPEGIAWRSARLAVDDLRVEQATAEAIVCSAWMLEDQADEVTLDPSTGDILEGRRLGDPWN